MKCNNGQAARETIYDFQTYQPSGFLARVHRFFTAGLFFVIYMPMGLQQELELILVHKIRPYWQVYLLGIPDLFIYPLVWMARIAEELKEKAVLNI